MDVKKVEKRLTRRSLASNNNNNDTSLLQQEQMVKKLETELPQNQQNNNTIRQSSRRTVSNNLDQLTHQEQETIKVENSNTKPSRSTKPKNITTTFNSNNNESITDSTVANQEHLVNNLNINTKHLKRKSTTSNLSSLKIDSLSSSLNAASTLHKSSSTSNIVTRKRHMSFSTTSGEHNVNLSENLNEDLNNNLNLNASSSNLTDSLNQQHSSKRFKFKFRDNNFDSTHDSNSNLASMNVVEGCVDANAQPAVKEDEMFCPVDGCDSSGHLDGISTRHYSYDNCPIYFNMSYEECKLRKDETEKRFEEYKTKLEQTNEYKKNLRHLPQPTESQQQYFQSMKLKLKDKLKPNEQALKNHLCERLLGNTDLLTNIKNITTSTLLNSMSIGINPTTSHASTSSTLAASNLIKSNIIYSCFNNNKTIQPCLVDDLNISKFELDMFKDALVSSSAANNKEDNKKKQLTLTNRNHKLIQFGNFEIETWYQSPYPDDYWQLDKIFVCQYCLIYMKSHSTLNRHLEKCFWRHPPGREIYRQDKLSFFEVDGKFNKAYCQNLCLLAKLFIDHKTLYYDVEPFLFYVLTKYNDQTGSFEMIGYFSKEKQSVMNYNLSCILILPPFMNKSYGRVLIDFSYLLSRVEEKYGSPERPLSDLGLISYRSYWKMVILNYLSKFMNDSEISIKELSLETGILTNDIISTLQFIGLIKYWKGKHVLLKDKDLIDKYVQKLNSFEMKLDPNCLKWTPYVWQTVINESDTPALSVIGKNNRKN